MADNDATHLAHGLAGEHTPPDWPPLSADELDTLLLGYPQLGVLLRIVWHSPRPLSAACVIETAQGRFFVKRHHVRVRSATTLTEEHRFIAHLRSRGLPIPEVLPNRQGHTATPAESWVYEVHAAADGIDLYREAISWTPPAERDHAQAAGRMLAELHAAADDYAAPQRATQILVARSELILSADPIAVLQAQCATRPGLVDYLRDRDWRADLGKVLTPWHARVQPALARLPRRWTHGDWHVSNLCWNDRGDEARVSAVLDFGLAAANFALFDLATAIERNAVAWLALEDGEQAARPEIARALIDGYRQRLPLDAAALDLLADLLPLVHVDFALSEVEYFHAITGSRANADIAYDTFLRGHAAWFHTAPGQALLESIRRSA